MWERSAFVHDPNTEVMTLPDEGGEIKLPGGWPFIVPKVLIDPDSGLVTVAEAGDITLPGADSALATDDDVVLRAPVKTTIHPYTGVTTTPDGSGYNPDGTPTEKEPDDTGGGGCRSGAAAWILSLVAVVTVMKKKRSEI